MNEVGAVEYWSSLGNVERVRKAIQDGADLNAISESGYNALYAAIENNHLDIVRLLLNAGAKTDLKLDTGETPLEFAIQLDRKEIVQMLRCREF